MVTYNQETPILLVLSEQLSLTNSLLSLINHLHPTKLYLYVEVQKEDDIQWNDTLRGHISWTCSLKIKRDTKSGGYNQTLLSANRWFFRNESEGIILNCCVNWGCIPTKSFFGFCSELLEKYRTDERIGHISSGRILRSHSPEGASYIFSRIPDVSFYATWRRVWDNFDYQMKSFRSFKKSNLIETVNIYRDFASYWNAASSVNELPWSEQYEYIQMINNRLSIVPIIPLVMYPNQQQATDDDLAIIHPRFIVEDIKSAIRSRELQLGMPSMHEFDVEGYSFIQERLTSLTEVVGSHFRIPKIIHHVCDYPNGVPENLLRLAATWKHHHPEWEQRFWGKEQMEEFVKEVCPDFESCYRAFPYDVQRWDAIRYLILYHIGGMYVDLDYECFQPFDSVLHGLDCCIATEPDLHAQYNGIPVMLSNALMAAVPGNSFMRKIIDMLKEQDLTGFADLETYKIVLNTTGPLMLTRMYESIKDKTGVTLLPDAIFMPLTPKEIALAIAGKATKFIDYKINNSFAVHYFFGSW